MNSILILQFRSTPNSRQRSDTPLLSGKSPLYGEFLLVLQDSIYRRCGDTSLLSRPSDILMNYIPRIYSWIEENLIASPLTLSYFIDSEVFEEIYRTCFSTLPVNDLLWTLVSGFNSLIVTDGGAQWLSRQSARLLAKKSLDRSPHRAPTPYLLGRCQYDVIG